MGVVYWERPVGNELGILGHGQISRLGDPVQRHAPEVALIRAGQSSSVSCQRAAVTGWSRRYGADVGQGVWHDPLRAAAGLDLREREFSVRRITARISS
jgi:hypothetical protein